MSSLDKYSEFAKKVLLKDGYHNPTIILQGSKSNAIAQFASFPDETDGKRLAMLKAGEALGKQSDKFGNAEEVYFITEAWMSVVEKEGFDVDSYVRPSLDPKRLEILMIMGIETKTNKVLTRAYKMIRGKDNKLAKVIKFNPSSEVPKKKKTKTDSGDLESYHAPLFDAFLIGYTKASLGAEVDAEREIEKLAEKENNFFKEQKKKEEAKKAKEMLN